MIENYEKIIKQFNEYDNNFFGYIDVNLLSTEKEEFELLYFLFPMIERIIRYILDSTGVYELESQKNETFKTINSIFENNNDAILEKFGDDFGVELIEYINYIYKESGIRDKTMHFNNNTSVEIETIKKSKCFFLKLIEFYVMEYCQ